MSHINDRHNQFDSVSDIDAAITLTAMNSNSDNGHSTSIVSPLTPRKSPVTNIEVISAFTDVASIMDFSKCSDNHGHDEIAAENAMGRGAGSYERKDSAATKPLPKKLPVAPKERHIPAYKKKTCALTFPERLMSLLDYAEKMKAESDDPDNYCVTWLPNGDAFLIRDPKECADIIIPKFFKAAKFSSFARKLYRWGFHQIQREDADAAALPVGAIIFASVHFKRDARHEMANMRSITAAGEKRKVDQIEGMHIKAKIDVNAIGKSGPKGLSSTGSLSASNLFIGSERGRGSVSSVSDITTRSASSRQPLKKRAIERMMSSFIPNEKNGNSSMITKSNSFENSTWGTITDFTEPSLPVLVNMPTSDGIKLNDQVSKFLTLMSQVGTHKASFAPVRMEPSRNLSTENSLLIPGHNTFPGGVSGRHHVLSRPSTNRHHSNNEHLIRLFRSAADALEKSIV
mmetsp:Transcript_17395/g.36445  ORF Transcript_17395/g.36445 Transcript_17395/m.36445 type:complete len:458 (+) Transcript_17395:74-1447(+)